MADWQPKIVFEAVDDARAEDVNEVLNDLRDWLAGSNGGNNLLAVGGTNPNRLEPAPAPGYVVRSGSMGVAEWQLPLLVSRYAPPLTISSDTAGWQKIANAGDGELVTPPAGQYLIEVTCQVHVTTPVPPSLRIARTATDSALDNANDWLATNGDHVTNPGWFVFCRRIVATLNGSESVALYGQTSSGRTCQTSDLVITAMRVA